jgi:fumarate hydratase class II
MASLSDPPSSQPLSDEASSVATEPNPMQEMAKELQAIYTDTLDRMRRQRRAAGRWGRMNLLIGVPAALFSGAAGAIAALADVSQNWKIAVTLLAVVASGLTTVATTLNASRRAEQASIQEAAYEALARDARVTLRVDLQGWSSETAREALETLIERLREIDGIPVRESFYRQRISEQTQESSSSTGGNASSSTGGNQYQF